MQMFKFFLLALLLASISSAYTLSGPEPPTKLQNGINITTVDFYNDISVDHADHYYIVRIPSGSVSVNYNKLNNYVNVKGGVLNFTVWQIDNETVYSKSNTICVKEDPINEECTNITTYSSYRTVTYTQIVTKIQTTISRNYLVQLTTLPFVSGNWGGAISTFNFDPVIASCGVLSSPNTIYTLGTTLQINGSTCITVNASNITLDCNGGSIIGSNSSSTYGVYTTQASTIIKNCNISNFDTGVYFFTTANNGFLTNNNISSSRGVITDPCYGSAVCIRSSNMSATNNLLTTNAAEGTLYIFGATNGTYINNTIKTINPSTYYGVYLKSNGASGNVFNSTSINLSGTTTTAKAVYLLATGDSNNIFNGLSIFTLSTGTGIYSIGSNNTFDCMGETLTGGNGTASYGIITTGTNITVKNCNINEYAQAVHFGSTSHSSSAINNNMSQTSTDSADPRYGMCITTRAANITVTGNSFNCKAGGLMIYSGAVGVNSITGNTINVGSLGAYGMWLYGANNFTIANNRINTTKALSYGIYLGDSPSNGNIFSNNTINSSLGHGYYISFGQNNSINCMGSTLIGGNASNTYGYYNAQNNNSLSNCIINNFFNGIYINSISGTNGTISNISITGSFTSGSGLRFGISSNNNLVKNLTSIQTGTNATAALLTTSIGNTLANMSLSCPSYIGLYIQTSSANNTIANSTITTNTFYSVLLEIASNNTFTNNVLSGKTASGAVLFYLGSKNNILANNTINAGAGGSAVGFLAGATIPTGNTIVNNTFLNGSATAALVNIDAPSGNNTFYWNNFTNTSGLYVQDLNGSNYYNSSFGGNFWFNVLNGSINITSLPQTASTYPNVQGSPVFIGNWCGTAGANCYPYNNTTSVKVVGNVQDWLPLVFSSFNGTFTITYALGMTSDGQQNVPCPGYFIQLFNSTVNPVGIFVNYTAFMNYTNGTIAVMTLDTNMDNFVNQTYTARNFPNGSCSMAYKIYVRVYTTLGYAQTDVRSITLDKAAVVTIPSASGGGTDLTLYAIYLVMFVGIAYGIAKGGGGV